MSAWTRLSKPALRDLLVSNWMTHDAMWFASSARLFGVENAYAAGWATWLGTSSRSYSVGNGNTSAALSPAASSESRVRSPAKQNHSGVIRRSSSGS